MKKRLIFILITLSLLAVGSASAQLYFTTTWKLNNTGVSNSSSLTIPTNSALTYSYQVDWNGDNDFNDPGESVLHTSDATHDYAPVVIGGSVKTIKIKGLFPQIYFNGGGDKDKILSIDQWGNTIIWASMEGAFTGCSNLVMNALDTPNLSNALSLFKMFRGAVNLGNSNANANWDWNTGNITNMVSLFRNATSFDKDISSWNVENVDDFSGMFTNVTLPTVIYDDLLISWDAQNLTDNSPFNGGDSKYCSFEARLAHRNLFLDDGLVIQDGGLCEEGYFITTWQINNPGVSNSTSLTIRTHGASTYFYQVDWNADGDFNDADENIDYTGDATHDYAPVAIGDSTKTIKIKGTFPRINFNGFGDKEKILSVEQWGTNEFSTMATSFKGAVNLVINAIDTPIVSPGGGYISMFKNASSIGTGAGNWDWNTENMVNMDGMFENTQFNKDIGSWDTSSVGTMERMFSGTPFDQNLEFWLVGNVTTMDFMFLDGGLSTVNYDATLLGWAQQPLQSNVIFGAGNSIYCAAATARQIMIDVNQWDIFDGGQCVTNQAPGITSPATVFMAENETLVTFITATDPDGDTLTFSTTGGDDELAFIIDSVTGELNFITAPDFENPNSAAGTNVYLVEVTVTDDGSPSLSHSLLLSVNVADVIEDIIFMDGFE